MLSLAAEEQGGILLDENIAAYDQARMMPRKCREQHAFAFNPDVSLHEHRTAVDHADAADNHIPIPADQVARVVQASLGRRALTRS